ncbi:MAG TPA: ATP-binding protein [Ignavibacteria bacterium]|nr:ATP-binding protein [Ignavibacteria bacterium]
MKIFKRNIEANLITALKDTPVILLNGARQSGKTFLLKEMVRKKIISDYITFDNIEPFTVATREPEDFLNRFKGSVILDEIQRIPEIFVSIKANVDRKRTPGKFILSGSADIFQLPKLTDSLAGRIEIHTLYPLSQLEINNKKGSFVDYIFSKKNRWDSLPKVSRKKIFSSIFRGGFPSVQNKPLNRLNDWFGSYINTIIQRDIRDISKIEKHSDIPGILEVLASRTMQLYNNAAISSSLKLPQTTMTRYIKLLRMVYLVDFMRPYSRNITKRISKAHKLYFTDTGVISFLLNLSSSFDNPFRGQIFENFVIMEIIKQISWSKVKPKIYFYRDFDGNEVDLILELRGGDFIAIEIKASTSVKPNDFKGLKMLKAQTGNKFLKGFVIYMGDNIYPYDKDIYSLPVNTLWDQPFI